MEEYHEFLSSGGGACLFNKPTKVSTGVISLGKKGHLGNATPGGAHSQAVPAGGVLPTAGGWGWMGSKVPSRILSTKCLHFS